MLYAVRRYLGISAAEWHSLSWDVQETYLNGLHEDPEVPFQVEQPAQQGTGPRVRKAETAQVVDISAMIRELESSPGARRRQ